MLDRLSIRYDPTEDRLELDVVTRRPAGDDAREYRFALTRRVTRDWLAQLARAVELSAPLPAHVDPATRREIAGTHHRALASQARYARASDAPARAPRVTGSRPVLLRRIDCARRRDGERWLLRLRHGAGESLDLVLTPATLHGVIELLCRRLQQTDWGLAAPVPADSPAPARRVVH
jgi:hypothetical protein